jgi:hypothetical protein
MIIIDLSEELRSKVPSHAILGSFHGAHPFLPGEEIDDLARQFAELKDEVHQLLDVTRYPDLYNEDALIGREHTSKATKSMTLILYFLYGRVDKEVYPDVIPGNVDPNIYILSKWEQSIRTCKEVQQTKMLNFIIEGVRATVQTHGGYAAFSSASKLDRKRLWLTLARVNPVKLAQNMYSGIADVIDWEYVFTAPAHDVQARRLADHYLFAFEVVCNLCAGRYLGPEHRRGKLLEKEEINRKVNDHMRWAKSVHRTFRKEISKHAERQGLRVEGVPVLPL